MPRLADKSEREETIARALRGCNTRLRKKLKTALGNPPDFNKIPPSLWKEVQEEQEECLLLPLMAMYIAAGTGLGLTVGLNRTDLLGLQDRARAWSDTVSRDVSTKVVDTTRTRLQKVSHDVRLGQAAEADFDKVIVSTTSDSRAGGIATTETTRAQTAGEADAADAANEKALAEPEDAAEEKTPEAPTKEKLLVARWVHKPPKSAAWNPPFHPCPVCIRLIGLLAHKWPAEFAEGPPAHPQCDCWLEWGVMDADKAKPILRSPFTGIPTDLVR